MEDSEEDGEENDPFTESEEENHHQDLQDRGIKPGLSFWIVYDVAEANADNFENLIMKSFVDSKLQVMECKSINGRNRKG